MSVYYICHFDHDLPTSNSEDFIAELNCRINSKAIVCDFAERDKFENKQWRVCGYPSIQECFNQHESITLFYKDDFLSFELELFSKVFSLWETNDRNGNAFLGYYSRRDLITVFSQNDSFTKEYFTGLNEFAQKILIPVFHSTELIFLTEDKGYGTFDKGDSIDEYLSKYLESFPKNFSEVYFLKNEETLGYGEGDEKYLNGYTTFLFDLDFCKNNGF